MLLLEHNRPNHRQIDWISTMPLLLIPPDSCMCKAWGDLFGSKKRGMNFADCGCRSEGFEMATRTLTPSRLGARQKLLGDGASSEHGDDGMEQRRAHWIRRSRGMGEEETMRCSQRGFRSFRMSGSMRRLGVVHATPFP